MSTPEELEAERAELDDQLLLAVETWYDDCALAAQTLAGHIAPALAAIRRHAAAHALHAEATRLHREAFEHFKQASTYPAGSAEQRDELAYGRKAGVSGRGLRRAAESLIMEGWEHTCAAETPATREDPAEGCEALVENEGEYCPRHETPEDADL
jgi:hypothetical protein